MTERVFPYALVVFDVAGTTVDDGDAVIACMQSALAPYLDVSSDQVREVMGLPKPQAIDILLSSRVEMGEDVRRVAVARCHHEFRQTLIGCYRSRRTLAPMPGAEQVFAALRRSGIRVALDTGFSRDILDALLATLDWNGSTLDCTVASDEVQRGRPHADMIQRAMALTGIDRVGAVVKVGDTLADLRQGFVAGCGRVVGVTYGACAREQLEGAGAVLIDNLPDLLPLIGVEPT